MLNFLERLVQIEGVKICVASRPWNIFNDFFRQCPTIQLQDFTRPDIEKFVRHSLSQSIQVQSTYLHNSGEAENLIAAVVNKASGVFLWVRLVVEQLLRGFRDGETIRTLKRKVESMPADLDGFFQKIIDSIDPPYRREGSSFFQAALFAVQNNNVDWPRGLIDFTYLEAEDPEFTTRPDFDFTELDLVDLEALEYRMDVGKRRLNSRCMGLLEPIEPTHFRDRLDQLLQTKVVFLHRTLVEFLLNTDSQRALHRLTDGPFQVDRFFCNTLLAKIVAISLSLPKHNPLRATQRECLIYYVEWNMHVLLRAFASIENVDPEVVYNFMNQLSPGADSIIYGQVSHPSDDLQSLFGSCKLSRTLQRFKGSRNLLMKVAIDMGILPYVRQYLAKHQPDASQMFDLFEGAVLCNPFQPRSLDILRCLIEAGADPNARKVNMSSTCEIFWGQLSRTNRSELSPIEVDVLELLIQYGGRMHELERCLDVGEMHNQGNDSTVAQSSDQERILNRISVVDQQKLKFAIREAERIRIVQSQDPTWTDTDQHSAGKRKLSQQSSGNKRQKADDRSQIDVVECSSH